MTEAARAIAAAVDGERLWQRLMAMAKIGATAKGGVNRQALSVEDRAARRLLTDWAVERGYQVVQDPVANLFVRRPGTDVEAPPVMLGSHLDSQPTGGRFDGVAGVLAAFEVLQALDDADAKTKRPVMAAAFTNEEGSRFAPGAMGSAVFAGCVRLSDVIGITDWDGVTVGDALGETLAALPEVSIDDALPRPAAFLELHIEQGPLLEAAVVPVGVVSAIQGISNFQIEVIGTEAHAGTTPRAQRRDALKRAAAMVLAMEEAFADQEDAVRFTVGRFDVSPGSPNTIPGRVRFTIDFRHPDLATIKHLTGRIEPICKQQAAPAEVVVQRVRDVPPTRFDPEIVALLSAQAERLGIAHLPIVSGAGHDAMHLATICPSAMIFCPCKDGVSHNEAESAELGDLAAATRVLAAAAGELACR